MESDDFVAMMLGITYGAMRQIGEVRSFKTRNATTIKVCIDQVEELTHCLSGVCLAIVSVYANMLGGVRFTWSSSEGAAKAGESFE